VPDDASDQPMGIESFGQKSKNNPHLEAAAEKMKSIGKKRDHIGVYPQSNLD